MRRGRKVSGKGMEWNDGIVDGWNPLVDVWHGYSGKGRGKKEEQREEEGTKGVQGERNSERNSLGWTSCT